MNLHTWTIYMWQCQGRARRTLYATCDKKKQYFYYNVTPLMADAGLLGDRLLPPWKNPKKSASR